MERAKLMETLLAELSANKQAVQALQSERNTIARTLQRLRFGRGKESWTSEKKQELAAQLDWMNRLLQTLTMEQERAEKRLRFRLLGLRDQLENAPSAETSAVQCRQEMERVPAVYVLKQVSRSTWKRFQRLAKHGVHVLNTEGCFAFLVKGTRRIYRKLANWFSRLLHAALSTKAPLPYIFRRADEALEPAYTEWIERNEPSAAELTQQRQTDFPRCPRISVVVPCYNTPLPLLLAMIESVRSQTYSHWELCIADGGSDNEAAKKMLEFYAQNDPRNKERLLPENLGIAGNTNAAIKLATGDYLTLLDHDDALPPFALFEVVKTINCHPSANFIYSDEDKLTETGRQRYYPHFKPAWSPDMLRSLNYICHLTVLSRPLFQKVGGFRLGFDGSQDYDLILRATEQANAIVHIPKVLYHWRSHSKSAASSTDAKPYAHESARKALTEHLARCRIDGYVQRHGKIECYRIIHRLPRRPLVSIVIPSRDQQAVLRRCIESIGCSTYTNYEIIIVENNSQDPRTFAYYAELEKRPEVRVIPWNQPFNYAAATNFGVRHAQGEMLLLLNNDMEIINRDWMEALLEYALRPDVGAVGAKLYYPNGTIQHGGVVLGLLGLAGHAGVRLVSHHPGYMRRLVMAHNLSAVTAACLMTPRDIYNEVGGLDERFILAFNDVDFCLKLRHQGYLIVWTPYAELYHFESLTRGLDDTPEKKKRFQSEVGLFAEKWRDLLKAGDPFYSPNLTLERHNWAICSTETSPQDSRLVSRKHDRTYQAA
jgi:glycosyltransferase involved in cell wall biosynthesis